MAFTNKEELERNIHSLKLKQAVEFELLKESIQLTSESLKPLNIIKNTFQDMIGKQSVKGKILETVLVLGKNYLVQKIGPKSPINKIGNILLSFFSPSH